MTLTVLGISWCNDCKMVKQFLGDHRIDYHYEDIDGNREKLDWVASINDGSQSIPVVVFDDGSWLIEPEIIELAHKLGIVTEAKQRFHDLIILGSGPAGLTAALYAAREGMETLVIERAGIGGQAAITEVLDNFPGFPEGVSGQEFATRLRRQAERFGVEIIQAQEAVGVRKEGDYFIVQTGSGGEYQSHAVLLATGSTYRRLGVEGEERFIGAGVHFCATCDGPFYRDQEVMVVGSGNSAASESLFLSRFAKRVDLALRGDQLHASQVLVDKVLGDPQIQIMPNTTIEGFSGEKRLQSVTVRQDGLEKEIRPDGVFVFIGMTPNTSSFEGFVEMDSHGFIITDGTLQTSVPGIFAAGDCRLGSTKQAASAAGEGAAAALSIRTWLEPVAGTRPAEYALDDQELMASAGD